MNKRPFSTDEETAIALCRTTYSGDCRCERNGTVICESMLREVEVLQPALSQLREAIALPTPLRDPDEMTCADGMQAADRIEALTEQLEAARADAKEAEAYAEELEKERDDYAFRLADANNTYSEMHIALSEANDKLAKAMEGLQTVDALDPEGMIDGCSQSALRGLVLRMGDISRATLAEIGGENG
jgi:hypothetical protein